MLIKALSFNNYNQFNIPLAHAIGLDAAIYCNEVIKIKEKAILKNKLTEEGYIKLDRKYIFRQTTLKIENQLNIDKNLSKIKLIEINENDSDCIKIDEDGLIAIINADESTLVNVLSKLKTKTIIEVRETKKQAIIRNLKESIVCSNDELLEALKGWVEAIYSSPSGFLSKKAIRAFQDDLNLYTQGDLDLALAIVKIATIQGYKLCQYAINVYEKNSKTNSSVRVTTQKNIADIGLSEDFF